MTPHGVSRFLKIVKPWALRCRMPVIAGLWLLQAAAFAGAQPLPGLEEPAHQLRDLVHLLEPHTEVVTLGSADGPLLVLMPEVGGIVLGAAPGGLDDWNRMWVSPQIAEAGYWANPPNTIGGVRSALAPQWGGPRRSAGDTGRRGSISNGDYNLTALDNTRAVLTYPFYLANEKNHEYRGIVTRTIELLPDHRVPQAPGVTGIAFSITHALTNTGSETWGRSVDPIGLWYILMVPSGGTAFTPIQPGSGYAWRDMVAGGFDAPRGERTRETEEVVTFLTDGARRTKIGTNPARTRPFAAYLRHLKGDPGLLVITEFLVDPGAVYVDYPRDDRSGNGDAVQFYNSNGSPGHYLEVENHSPAMMLAPGETAAHTTVTWLMTGPVDRLKDLAGRMMSLDMNAVPWFE